jgi:NAD(P) transhydrogenase subunit alpha
MRVGFTTETAKGENRVSLTPETAKALIAKGHKVVGQQGAGERAGYSDEEYTAVGVELAAASAAALDSADIWLKVNAPSLKEIADLSPKMAVVSFLFPTTNLDLVAALAEKGVTCFAMDLMPRITRAQSMDALSAMSTIAGYKASLLAAEHLPKFFPMLMTAAGTLPPARVLVIGAGVAGLQAIATCRRLGAIVEAFDVRPAAKEQVESLGAKFVAVQILSEDAQDASGYAKEVSADTHARELELIGSRMAKNDVVITTALIPGRPAPVLITREMVKLMPRGSVIIDLAATNGGNCEATKPDETVELDGVKIMGPTHLLSEMGADASRMYAKNIATFLMTLAPEGSLKIDLDDQIIRDTLVTHEANIHHEPTRKLLEAKR